MMSSTASLRRDGGAAWAALAAAVAVLGLAGLEIAALRHAGGVFDYPLDDVYIHLAMAESILEGGYGINPGEPASAASSILYPLLLVPLFGAKLQLWMPLAWNVLGVAASGALWGAGVARAAIGPGATALFAVLGPVTLNLAGIGFTGMENSLHVAAALATTFGLWIFLSERRIGALLLLGTFFAPLLRLEGLALSGLACAVIALGGRPGAGIALGLATLAPVAGFMAFLHGLGLAMLPGSVLAKAGMIGAGASGLDQVIFRVAVNLAETLTAPAGMLLAGATLLCLALPAFGPGLRDRRGAALVVVGLAGLAHLIGGQIGWMHRYEIYVLASQALVLVIALAGTGPGARAALVGALLISALVYWPKMIGHYLWNPRAVHLQQAQMARFAKDYWKGPVAVNDLGWVAWQNPNYILDLYGLAAPEVLALRADPATPAGWAAPLVARHGIGLAMIYDKWLKSAVGPDWVLLGQLVSDEDRAALGDEVVSFYATDPAQVAQLRAELADFAPTLPAGVVWQAAP